MEVMLLKKMMIKKRRRKKNDDLDHDEGDNTSDEKDAKE